MYKKGQTVNGEFYWNVKNRLLARIRRVWPHLAALGKWFLLHDNACLHAAMCVRRYIEQQQVTELFHPLYFHDLGSETFSSFHN